MAVENFQNKITKQELTQKMKDLNDILNNSWDGIAIIDDSGNFIFTNNALTPILNYTKEDLLKLNIINIVNESSRDILKFALIKATKLGNLKNIKVVFTRKDKQKVYLELSLALMANGKYFVLNARDYTEKVAKDEIINKYVLSCQIDTNGNIVDISEAMLNLTKYLKNELLGQPYSILKTKNTDGEDFSSLMTKISNGDRWSGLVKNVDKNGDIFWLDTKIKPQINKYGDIVGYILISFDVTDKKKLVELNEQLKIKLDLSENDTKQKNSKIIDQSKFVALGNILENVTNNWLEPLNDIEVKVQNLQKVNYPQEELQTRLASISKTIVGLKTNIEKFKKTFKIKNKPEETNIKKVLADVVAMLERNNDKHQVVIHQDLHEVTLISSYPSELLDVFLSIITNSLEAFRKRKIKNPILDINLVELDDEIIIQILDNAGGVDKNIIEKIFDPYFSTKEEKGKGMGLYFAKTLIENHMMGKLTIDNKDGYTDVTIKIPTKASR